MRKWIRILVAYIMMGCCLGCSQQEDLDVVVNYERSFLNCYYEENGTVHIICTIDLKNVSNQDIRFRVRGYSPEDVDGGLLKTSSLIGINTKTNDEYFLIKADECTIFMIDFRGEYGGNLQKADRLIPEVTILCDGETGDNVGWGTVYVNPVR